MNARIRVLIADDHKLFLVALRTLLDADENIRVVGEAADGRQAVALTKKLLPNVVILDDYMPEMNGITAAERINSESLPIRTLILSTFVNESSVLEALRAGATGFLSKNTDPADLVQAVKSVAQGQYCVAPEALESLVRMCLKFLDRQEGGPNRLTLRQREVLQLISEGHTTKSIAKKLGIHVKTAEMHRTQLMNALGLRNTASLVRYAVSHGVIPLEIPHEEVEKSE